MSRAVIQYSTRLVQAVPVMLLALVCAAAVADTARAGECGYKYCWGAVALGDLGAAGRASGMRSSPGAVDRAQQTCSGKCDIVEMFVNSCGAIAQDSKATAYFDWDDTRALAEAKAMARCEAEGKGCRIRVWACSR